MATENFIPVPTIPPEQNVDVEQVVVNAQTVNRQRVILVPGQLPHGCSNYHAVSAAGTNAAIVKAGPGNVYGWRIYNNAGYPIYVKLHNTAGAPTPGTGVVATIAVQAGTIDDEGDALGMAFATGIGISIVKGLPDGDTTPVAANDCVVDLQYA